MCVCVCVCERERERERERVSAGVQVSVCAHVCFVACLCDSEHMGVHLLMKICSCKFPLECV